MTDPTTGKTPTRPSFRWYTSYSAVTSDPDLLLAWMATLGWNPEPPQTAREFARAAYPSSDATAILWTSGLVILLGYGEYGSCNVCASGRQLATHDDVMTCLPHAAVLRTMLGNIVGTGGQQQ